MPWKPVVLRQQLVSRHRNTRMKKQHFLAQKPSPNSPEVIVCSRDGCSKILNETECMSHFKRNSNTDYYCTECYESLWF